MRVPGHIMGPFETEAELHDFLLGPASPISARGKYEEKLLLAKKIQQRSHRITFTHGDLKAHKILVDDDRHLSGFLDWGYSGWYPEYWEFTTAMRFGKDSWWYQVASWMSEDQYSEDLASDLALHSLTMDSYI